MKKRLYLSFFDEFMLIITKNLIEIEGIHRIYHDELLYIAVNEK